MNCVHGTVVRGHGVASGTSQVDRRFPEGTIRAQLPFFKERGLDVCKVLGERFFPGTLNLSLTPCTYRILKPEYVFVAVAWTHRFPPENFFLSHAQVRARGASYRALLYIPDPATKPDHLQPAGVLEVLAEFIPELAVGDDVELEYRPEAIDVVRPPE